MNDSRDCGNRDILVSYLYGEGDEQERLAFAAHLERCERCAREVAELQAVRQDLAEWSPPEMVLGFRVVRAPEPPRSRWAWLRPAALPAWAQLAAASLVIGVAVGLSGLEIRYDSDGFVATTGWTRPAAQSAAVASPHGAAAPAAAPIEGAAPWKTDLAAMREQLLDEMRQAAPARPVSAAADRTMSDAELLARVRQLVEASETRTERELALRLTQAMRDIDAQRRADMTRVADSFGVLEGRTGAAVAQQRELMNYLVRVSQRQQ